jgi:hypothetical protein
MVSKNRPKLLTGGTPHDGTAQSALLDLLAQLKLTDVTDRICLATEKLYQELIDAEVSA